MRAFTASEMFPDAEDVTILCPLDLDVRVMGWQG